MRDYADQSELLKEANRREDKARGGFWYWLMGERFSWGSLLAFIGINLVTLAMGFWFFEELIKELGE